jgi:hypothetical protein
MAWLDRRPGPTWLYYLAALTFIIVAYLLALWWEGKFPAVVPVTGIYIVISAFIYLGAMHLLDHAARHAMTRFRPAIEAPAWRVAELEYQLTTMPARTTWYVTLLGILAGLLLMGVVLAGAADYPGLLYTESSIAAGLEFTAQILVCIVFSLFAYHTIHQMRTVSAIYTELTKIDLFNQEPLHAFARLAAYTGIAIMMVQYLWFTIGLTGVALGVSFGFLAVAAVLAGSLFIWPLYGIHRLLAAKKDQRQGEASHRLEKSIKLFADALEHDNVAEMAAIGAAMRNAEQELQIVKAIPTWPWPPGLLRGTMTAFFLPVIIWGATRLLERFLGG